MFANKSNLRRKAAERFIPPCSGGGYAALSEGPKIIPSEVSASLATSAGKVVP